MLFPINSLGVPVAGGDVVELLALPPPDVPHGDVNAARITVLSDKSVSQSGVELLPRPPSTGLRRETVSNASASPGPARNVAPLHRVTVDFNRLRDVRGMNRQDPRISNRASGRGQRQTCQTPDVCLAQDGSRPAASSGLSHRPALVISETSPADQGPPQFQLPTSL